MREKRRAQRAPDVRAALLAARYAQRIGLPPGNLWEPAIARNITLEARNLGDDDKAWAFVQAMYEIRLGLDSDGAPCR